jgi:branched-chain amino acid transport system substrate-binding protein
MKKAGIVAVLAVLAALATAASGASRVAFSPASVKSAANALVKCGTTQTIGIAYPATGDAASIGVLQFHWAQFFQTRWNKTHKKNKIRFVQGDTRLPQTQFALAVAHQFASNSSMLGLVGPAGSQEVQDTVAIYKAAGLAVVTGSATRVALTRGKPSDPRETPANYFFRTVPNDGQQGDRVAFWINKKLKRSRIYIIDDEESYSQGLADQVQTRLKAAGKNVTRDHVSQQISDFSSVITRIPSNTQVVYIPWQLAGKAQLFYTQLRAAGKSAVVFGSDGTFAPGTFSGAGSYVSAFPIDFKSATLKAYKRTHGGQEEAFGLPSYTAALVNAKAIVKACKNGTATRAEVRKNILKTKLTKKESLLGFPVRFLKKNTGAQLGAGDMALPADFAVFRIGANGNYNRVG